MYDAYQTVYGVMLLCMVVSISLKKRNDWW